MPTYRILSLDGGGLRGLITARLLQRLDAMPGIAGWLGRADLLVGTSTGGILALGLAAGAVAAGHGRYLQPARRGHF
jgi:patatin-like phospholipase/acyl hydrolase